MILDQIIGAVIILALGALIGARLLGRLGLLVGVILAAAYLLFSSAMPLILAVLASLALIIGLLLERRA